jgi:membrane protein
MSNGAAEPSGRIERLARRPLEHVGGVVRGVARALPRAIEDMFTDRCTQYAAAIAYRVLFSLFPLAIAIVSVFGLVLQDDELRQQVVNELTDLLPVSQSGQGNIQQSIDQIATPLSAIGLISLVALLWGASGMMASIRLGLEAAMKVDRGRPAARAKLVDFILVAAAGVLVVVIVGLSAFGAFFSKLVDRFTEWAGIATPSGLLLRDGVQLVAIAVTVLLLYRFVPARKLRRRGALAGAILTAVGVWG